MNQDTIKKHTLLIGLNDKDTKTQLINTSKAKRIVMNIVGDCTISNAQGVYTHEDGKRVIEKCLRVEMLFKADNEVESFCSQLKKLLNQEKIALTTSYEQSVLV